MRPAGVNRGTPLGEFGKNRKPISPNQLAKLLRPFSVSSRNLRVPILTAHNTPSVRKGYFLEDFADAFARYLPPNGDSNRYNATGPANKGENAVFGNATDGLSSGSQNPQNPNKDAPCSGVADEKSGETGEKGKEAEQGGEPGADYV